MRRVPAVSPFVWCTFTPSLMIVLLLFTMETMNHPTAVPYRQPFTGQFLFEGCAYFEARSSWLSSAGNEWGNYLDPPDLTTENRWKSWLECNVFRTFGAWVRTEVWLTHVRRHSMISSWGTCILYLEWRGGGGGEPPLHNESVSSNEGRMSAENDLL